MNTERFKRSILQMMVTALTLLVADYLMDSVYFSEPYVALITALVLGLLNTFLKPLLVLLTIPATILTLGIFLLVINAAILMITDQLVDGFEIRGFGYAVLLAIFISIVNAFAGGNVQVKRYKGNDDEGQI